MSAVTREILREELKYFKNELLTELLQHRFDGFRFDAPFHEESIPSTPRVDSVAFPPAELPYVWPSSGWASSGSDPKYVALRSNEPDDSIAKPDSPRYTSENGAGACGALGWFAKHDWFERFILACIMLNLVLFVYETDYLARNWLEVAPRIFFDFEIVLLSIFTFEIVLRLIVDGSSFFVGPESGQNLFDLSLVILQACEVTLKLFKVTHKNFTDILRVLRVTRIFRAGRIVHLVPSLHILFSSIASSVESLMWIMVLVVLTVGSFAVAITQVVTDHKMTVDRNGPGQEVLENYFGTLNRTRLKLYQVMTDGVHWIVLADALMEYVSPWAGLILVVYAAFVSFALLNVVTAVFVESAVAEAQQDSQKMIGNSLWKNFQKTVFKNDFEVTEEIFNNMLNAPAMQDYLRKLGLDPDRAREIGLFHLIDRDHSGSLNSDEVLEECIRLLGYSRAVDVAHMTRIIRQVYDGMAEQQKQIEEMCGLIKQQPGFVKKASKAGAGASLGAGPSPGRHDTTKHRPSRSAGLPVTQSAQPRSSPRVKL